MVANEYSKRPLSCNRGVIDMSAGGKPAGTGNDDTESDGHVHQIPISRTELSCYALPVRDTTPDYRNAVSSYSSEFGFIVDDRSDADAVISTRIFDSENHELKLNPVAMSLECGDAYTRFREIVESSLTVTQLKKTAMEIKMHFTQNDNLYREISVDILCFIFHHCNWRQNNTIPVPAHSNVLEFRSAMEPSVKCEYPQYIVDIVQELLFCSVVFHDQDHYNNAQSETLHRIVSDVWIWSNNNPLTGLDNTFQNWIDETYTDIKRIVTMAVRRACLGGTVYKGLHSGIQTIPKPIYPTIVDYDVQADYIIKTIRRIEWEQHRESNNQYPESGVGQYQQLCKEHNIITPEVAGYDQTLTATPNTAPLPHFRSDMGSAALRDLLTFASAGLSSMVCLSLYIPSTVTYMPVLYEQLPLLKVLVIERDVSRYDPARKNRLGGDDKLHIRPHMCENMKHLESVRLSDNIVGISHYAFSGCIRLKNINMPFYLKDIGEYAFAECTALETLVIPSLTEWVDDYAFYGCDNLHVVVNPRLTTLHDHHPVYCTASVCLVPSYIDMTDEIKMLNFMLKTTPISGMHTSGIAGVRREVIVSAGRTGGGTASADISWLTSMTQESRLEKACKALWKRMDNRPITGREISKIQTDCRLFTSSKQTLYEDSVIWIDTEWPNDTVFKNYAPRSKGEFLRNGTHIFRGGLNRTKDGESSMWPWLLYVTNLKGDIFDLTHYVGDCDLSYTYNNRPGCGPDSDTPATPGSDDRGNHWRDLLLFDVVQSELAKQWIDAESHDSSNNTGSGDITHHTFFHPSKEDIIITFRGDEKSPDQKIPPGYCEKFTLAKTDTVTDPRASGPQSTLSEANVRPSAGGKSNNEGSTSRNTPLGTQGTGSFSSAVAAIVETSAVMTSVSRRPRQPGKGLDVAAAVQGNDTAHINTGEAPAQSHVRSTRTSLPSSMLRRVHMDRPQSSAGKYSENSGPQPAPPDWNPTLGEYADEMLAGALNGYTTIHKYSGNGMPGSELGRNPHIQPRDFRPYVIIYGKTKEEDAHIFTCNRKEPEAGGLAARRWVPENQIQVDKFYDADDGFYDAAYDSSGDVAAIYPTRPPSTPTTASTQPRDADDNNRPHRTRRSGLINRTPTKEPRRSKRIQNALLAKALSESHKPLDGSDPDELSEDDDLDEHDQELND